MSKTNTFILQGKKSFSDSKLEQLNFDFNKINNQDAEISSNEIYILASKNQDLNLDDLKNSSRRPKYFSWCTDQDVQIKQGQYLWEMEQVERAG